LKTLEVIKFLKTNFFAALLAIAAEKRHELATPRATALIVSSQACRMVNL
jgi:hypothetical protein